MMDNLVSKKFTILEQTIKELYEKINGLDKEIHSLRNERKTVKEGIRVVKKLCCDVLSSSNEIKNNFDSVGASQLVTLTRADRFCQTESICCNSDKETQIEMNKIDHNLPKVIEKPRDPVCTVNNVSKYHLKEDNEIWTEVVSKKNKRRAQRNEKELKNSKEIPTKSSNKFKNYAILIKFPQNFDSVWVVKQIKNLLEKNNKLAVSIVGSRKCKNGDFLLEIKKDGSLMKITEILEKHFGNVCKIQPKCNMKNLSIAGFDDFSSEKDIFNDLRKISPNGNIDYFKLTKVGQLKYRGNFANVIVDEKFGKLLINLNKIKIGFNNCQIKEWLKPIQCHFCLCYGHVKSHCDSLILEKLRGRHDDMEVYCSFDYQRVLRKNNKDNGK